MSFFEILLIISAYLIGSIPFAYLFTKKFTGKNIFKKGSGNAGSTNVRRIAGKRVSIYTQLADMMKGLVPVALVLYFSQIQSLSFNPYLVYAVALASILGHNFSIFVKFKGGKGVNTTLGASVLLAPFAVFFSVGIYFLVKWLFKFVSLSSIVLAISLPLIEWILNGVSPKSYYLLICALLIVIMHNKNITRLLGGQENR